MEIICPGPGRCAQSLGEPFDKAILVVIFSPALRGTPDDGLHAKVVPEPLVQSLILSRIYHTIL